MDRKAERHLNITLPIIGLIVKDNTFEKSSPLCSFIIFLLDGSFHDIGISKDPSASIFSAQALNNTSMLRGLQDVYCCDYYPKLSLLVVVSSTGDIQSTSNRSSDLAGEDIKQRLKLAEGHVEAGRLLAYYQVPKPISFFLDACADERSAKQIIRLSLSKFTRSQPGRTDHDWANMWRDLQSLQEKAFPFLYLEYMLMEFCRALLKAGKFSLARNYLKGTSSVALGPEKGEVLQGFA